MGLVKKNVEMLGTDECKDAERRRETQRKYSTGRKEKRREKGDQ